MTSKVRAERIADRFHKELSELFIHEIIDPRLHQIFITDVRVDRELAFADVYVSAMEGTARSGEILAGLKHAAGYLRHELASRVELRTCPQLRFHWDPTPENADHIERLLAELRNNKETTNAK